MPKINLYLSFNGNALEAFEFYKTVFWWEFSYSQKYHETPWMEDLNQEDIQKIMHIELPIFEQIHLMGTDILESFWQKVVFGNNMSVFINTSSKEETQDFFKKISEWWSIQTELWDTFWWDYYGMCIDKFWISWMLNYHNEQEKT